MRTLSETLGAHAGGWEYSRPDGTKIQVKPLTLKIMGKFEKWMESRAIELCMQMKSLDPKLFKAAFEQVSHDITKGVYAFGNELCQEALQTTAGIGQLVALMCDVKPELAMEIITQDGDGFRSILDLAIKASLPHKEDGGEGNETAGQTE